MKKNISINISGIIFHIEEDGYDRLKAYLESINRYFSSFEDSAEIIADIEGRIAEVFLARLNEGQQVVTSEDVDGLIATMGTIADFEAIEEQETLTDLDININTGAKEEAKEDQATGTESTADSGQAPPDVPTDDDDADTDKDDEPKKLYRDTKRKLIAGVASGLAHYFKIDPLWIRLLLVLTLFGFILGPLSAAVLVAYIIMWIIVPQRDDLQEDKKVKKLFRNPDKNVLGGVCSGLAAYFNTDLTVVRLIFFAGLFLGGLSLIIYIVLWIITPEAQTITEKMEMQGQPVTLTNIENSVKESLNEQDAKEESLLVKILLFPFRLVAAIFTGLGKILGPLFKFFVDAIRIFIGAMMVIVGGSFMFSALVFIGVIIGLLNAEDYLYVGEDVFFEPFINLVTPITGFALFFTAFIPALAVTLAGLVVILRRRVLNTSTSWAIFSVWLISLIIISFTIPSTVNDFRRDAIIEQVDTYTFNDSTVYLKINDTGYNTYDAVSLRLRAHDSTYFELVSEYQARGRSIREAEANTKTVEYNVVQKDSSLTFDSNLRFVGNAPFRAQTIDMTLNIPRNRPFKMDYNMRWLLTNTLYNYGYRGRDIVGNTWIFDQGGLRCLTCTGASSRGNRSTRTGNTDYTEAFTVNDFKEVLIDGDFKVNIEQGDSIQVLMGGNPKRLRDVKVTSRNGQLEVSDQAVNLVIGGKNTIDVYVKIVMPTLEYLELENNSRTYIDSFAVKDLRIELADRAFAEIKVNSSGIVSTNLRDRAGANFSGTALELKANLDDRTELNTYDLDVPKVYVETDDRSTARVHARDEISGIQFDRSNIYTRGTPNINIDRQ